MEYDYGMWILTVCVDSPFDVRLHCEDCTLYPGRVQQLSVALKDVGLHDDGVCISLDLLSSRDFMCNCITINNVRLSLLTVTSTMHITTQLA